MAEGDQIPNYQQPVNAGQAPFDASQPSDSQGSSQSRQDDYDGPIVSWTASEFIAHAKTAGWYAILIGVTVVVAATLFLLTRDAISTVMVIIVATLFGVMGSRKPRELSYSLDEDGVVVGQKLYPYESFKSFSVIQEGGVESIWFMPMQRLMPGLTIYFAPDQGDQIMDILSEFLPFEPRDTDPIDKLMHRLRF
ncbi:hypothetical protein EKI60_02020 [Candidatus Saccharibacteria bacterium]|nr:MAG: hypothetical protein EKI60_02020 [Candidatus Saccharibacteria bacterium]